MMDFCDNLIPLALETLRSPLTLKLTRSQRVMRPHVVAVVASGRRRIKAMVNFIVVGGTFEVWLFRFYDHWCDGWWFWSPVILTFDASESCFTFVRIGSSFYSMGSPALPTSADK